jgi:DNA invertase Pin-like site-specific DNA recombinase
MVKSKLSVPKIGIAQLALMAIVYIRQSTDFQALNYTGSTERQYEMRQRALELGWPADNVTVVDQDQGQSGTTVSGRNGFIWMQEQIYAGHVGAVFCLESSRLTRNGGDFLRLIRACADSGTLIIDEHGVHDPNNDNDHLLLSILGVIAEADHRALKAKLHGAMIKKAELGLLKLRLPAGFVHDMEGRVVLDPDEEVRRLIRLAFETFDQSSSARSVIKQFNERNILFPTRITHGVRHGELAWRPLEYTRFLTLLRNPVYAGVYVYGRGSARQMDDWTVVKRGNHEGYISWSKFLKNEQRIIDNRTSEGRDNPGAARTGAALLQGVVYCGNCAKRMTVKYYGENGNYWMYQCEAESLKYAVTKRCETVSGMTLDENISQLLLQSIAPAQLEIAVSALEHAETQALREEGLWRLRYKRAKYEAELAEIRYKEANPKNNLVIPNLEQDWNDKLTTVQRLGQEYEEMQRQKQLRLSDPNERQSILLLAQVLPKVWHATTTTQVERKQILRALINRVNVNRIERSVLHVTVHWSSNVYCELNINLDETRRQHHQRALSTDPAIIARIRELAITNTDTQVAAALTEEGLVTKRGLEFSAQAIRRLRNAYGIPSGCPEHPKGKNVSRRTDQRGDGRYSVLAVAQLLNQQRRTITGWCRSGVLDAIRSGPHAPFWIKITPEDIIRLKKPT